jgi:hypothetical protein
MSLSHYDSDPTIQKQHPKFNATVHSYKYRPNQNAQNSVNLSPVIPAPVDTHDEYAIDAADWVIGPVFPGEGKKLTDDLKRAYVEHVAKTGLCYQAASALGLEYSVIEKEQRTNPDFSGVVELALRHYGERVQQTVASRAMYGWLEPHYDDRGNLVGHTRKFDHRLLHAEAKRTNNGYQQADKDIQKIGLPKRQANVQQWYDQNFNK